MRSTFLDPPTSSGECFQTNLRLLHTLEPQLIGNEIIISKDYRSNETLVGKPAYTLTKYNGKLYEKLIQLELPEHGQLSESDKKRVIDFVSMYGSPVGPIKTEAMLTPEGAEINWVFIPYTINTIRGEGNFFTDFRNMYTDFVETMEAIISEDKEILYNFEGTFNIGLQGNYLSLRNQDDLTPFKWVSNTCLNLCYLELYNLLISKQKLKVCKYCKTTFESSKSNENRCQNCQKPDVYRRAYYYQNHNREKELSKLRMRKHRVKKVE